MCYIRLLRKEHYDATLGRFTSVAFKPSSNGGISVFDQQCAEETSRTSCQHILNFYAAITGSPVIYWVIRADVLPHQCSIRATPSDTGDLCHHDIELKRQVARALLPKSLDPTCMFVCDGTGQSKPIQSSDVE